MKKITINEGACGLRVYSKQGFNFSVGVRQTSPSSVDIYTIEGEEPKYFITITDKQGGDITDDVILSHVEIFFEN